MTFPPWTDAIWPEVQRALDNPPPGKGWADAHYPIPPQPDRDQAWREFANNFEWRAVAAAFTVWYWSVADDQYWPIPSEVEAEARTWIKRNTP